MASAPKPDFPDEETNVLERIENFETYQSYEDALRVKLNRYLQLANECVKINILMNRRTSMEDAVQMVASKNLSHQADLMIALKTFKDPISVAGHYIEMAKTINELITALNIGEDKNVNRQRRVYPFRVEK